MSWVTWQPKSTISSLSWANSGRVHGLRVLGHGVPGDSRFKGSPSLRRARGQAQSPRRRALRDAPLARRSSGRGGERGRHRTGGSANRAVDRSVAELPRLPACQGPKTASRRPGGPSLTGRQARKKRLPSGRRRSLAAAGPAKGADRGRISQAVARAPFIPGRGALRGALRGAGRASRAASPAPSRRFNPPSKRLDWPANVPPQAV